MPFGSDHVLHLWGFVAIVLFFKKRVIRGVVCRPKTVFLSLIMVDCPYSLISKLLVGRSGHWGARND